MWTGVNQNQSELGSHFILLSLVYFHVFVYFSQRGKKRKHITENWKYTSVHIWFSSSECFVNGSLLPPVVTLPPPPHPCLSPSHYTEAVCCWVMHRGHIFRLVAWISNATSIWQRQWWSAVWAVWCRTWTGAPGWRGLDMPCFSKGLSPGTTVLLPDPSTDGDSMIVYRCANHHAVSFNFPPFSSTAD